MALRDGQEPRAVLRDNPAVRERVVNECVERLDQKRVVVKWLGTQLSLPSSASGC